MKNNSKLIIVFCALLALALTGCASSKSKIVMPPNGGAAISVTEPIWLSGIKLKGSKNYSSGFPDAVENEYFTVINAGYWLANTNGKLSQLVYTFDLNIAKELPFDVVYTRSIFSNPKDQNNPIIYEGLRDKGMHKGAIKITHVPVENVKLGGEYHLVFEAYRDSARTDLITRVDQKIISPADNSSGCIKLDDSYMKAVYGDIIDSNGYIIPTEKLIIACQRY